MTYLNTKGGPSMKKTLKTIAITLVAAIIIGGAAFAAGATWSGSQDVEAIGTYLDSIDNLLSSKNQTIKDLEKQVEEKNKKDEELKQAEKDVKQIRQRLEQILNKYN